jgi:hypothetical protein
MLDTFIGANDGVPFLISGETEFLTTLREFQDQKDIPDYIEAYETQDLKNPGTVARMQLKGIHLPGVELDPIERMYVCRWPRNDNAPFELKERGPLQAMNDPPDAPKDSCVVLYWPTQNLNPGEKRHLAFTYGLNKLAISPSAGTTGSGKEGQLGLTAREAVRPGEEFPVTAYVTSTESDLKVKLSLPGGLRFAEGQQAEKPVPEGKGFRPVSWKVVAGGDAGTFDLKASLGSTEAVRKVRVKSTSLFD